MLSMEPLPALPPAEIWLVDGYNVLHAGLLGKGQRVNWWHRSHRDRLVERVRNLEPPRAEIWIVFDGADEGERPTGHEQDGGLATVRVVFARSADDWILAKVRQSPEPATLAVVTGDQQVAGRARHRGAIVVSPRLFLDHCPQPEPGGEDDLPKP